MSQELASKLLERNRVGALLRIFAPTPDVVEHQIELATTSLKKLLALKTGDKPTFSRIDFLVSNDHRFSDSDCDLTTTRLREVMDTQFPDAPVNVLNIRYGDIYCMLLNYGIVNQLEDRVPYTCIISNHASLYITQEHIDALLAAMYQKARVAGLAFGKHEKLVQTGRVMNTFSMWHNKSLITVGGFDLRAMKPLKSDMHKAQTVVGHSTHLEEHFGEGKAEYHVAGCEEIIPLIRMTRIFGQCIKIVSASDSTLSWGSDREKDPVGYQRHHAKLATKDARQRYMAGLEGESIDFLKTGLMEE